MKKRFKIIMLPTDKDGVIWKFDASDKLIVAQGTMVSDLPFKKFDIAVVSDDEPKVGDVAILDWEGKLNFNDLRIGEVESVEPNFGLRNQYNNLSVIPNDGRYPNAKKYKVITTSCKEITPDYWIDLSKESWIIDYFNLNNKFPEVDLEMEYNKLYPMVQNNNLKIKTSEDNSVIISPSKMFSKEEVEKLIIAGYKQGAKDEISGSSFYVSDEWIEENLR